MLAFVRFACLSMTAGCLFISTVSAGPLVRIKDITTLEGAHNNVLQGWGLVVGLKGTGSKSAFTTKVAADLLQRHKVTTIKEENQLKLGNVSVVHVRAVLGPWHRAGSKIAVKVAVFDDATSIEKGVLIETPLKGLDGVVYATAGGSINTGSFSAGGPGTSSPTATAEKNHPTVGIISNGAQVELEERGNIVCNGRIRLILRNQDFGTARQMAKVINKLYPGTAFALDPGTVQVFLPFGCSNAVSFVSELGLLEVEPDTPARVVVNERTGTIVLGHNVKISKSAIAHSNLFVVSSNDPEVSQPAPLSQGKTTVVPRSKLGVTEQNGTLRVLDETLTLGELVQALNALGIPPRDLITMLHELHAAGHLQAELITN